MSLTAANEIEAHSPEPVAVLLSGGLDSSVLLHYVVKRLACRPVFVLSFQYGQRHVREVTAARRQVAALASAVKEHSVIDLTAYRQLIGGASALVADGGIVPDLADIGLAERDQPVTYVPNRNLILLSLAAAFAESRGCRVVYYGAQRQDEYGYWDCSSEFVGRLNSLLKLNRRNAVEIRAPFISRRKSEEILLGIELGVDFAATWSCYRGDSHPCGSCPTCVERRNAFGEVGIEDPLSG